MKSNYFPRDADAHELLTYRLHCASNPKLVRDEAITFLTPLDLIKDIDRGPVDAPLIDKFGTTEEGESGKSVGPVRELSLKEIEMQMASNSASSDFSNQNDGLDNEDHDDNSDKKKKKSKLPVSKAKGRK